MFWKIVSTFLLGTITLASAASEWDYSDGNLGPAMWGTIKSTCSGLKQSPINIDPTVSLSLSSLSDFTFHDYDSAALKMTLKSNGHAVQVDIQEGNPRISNGDLPETYHLAQFHFHWGSTNNRGSEHTLRGQQYPMEVHFVHWADSRGNLSLAADKPQGLAVLGFFFQVGAHNSKFDNIVNNLTYINETMTSINIPTFSLLDLLPNNVVNGEYDYFRYSGSLTTPGCYQSVIWTVFENAITISQAQLDMFRSVMYDGHAISNNYRPVQSLNMRTVFTNKLTERDVVIVRDSATNLTAFSSLTTLLIALATLLRI